MRLTTGALGCLVLLLTCLGCSSSASAAEGPRVSVNVTSADLELALAARPGGRLREGSMGPAPITVDERQRYQPVTGFGATFTDSSASLLYRALPSSTRQQVLKRLFTKSGIALNLLRQPMGATDFVSNGLFTYDDNPPGGTDPEVTHFSIAHDQPYVLPVLRAARAIDPQLLVILTAWTAPAWMKSNHSLTDGGSLLPRYNSTWARYYAKAISAYAAAGVPIWATSGQNEPSVTAKYPSMTWTADRQAGFLSRYLEPALQAARLHPRILVGDTVCFDAAYPGNVLAKLGVWAAQHAGGISEHGYCGNPAQLSALHQAFPRLAIYQTELSPGCQPRQTVDLGIDAFRNWAQSVVTWNVALDPHGGPYYTGGPSNCTGLVTIDPHTHGVTYNRAFFQEGQFSRYVARGAYRIRSDAPVGSPLHNVAFRNPDGEIVLVVHNTDPGAAHRFTLHWHGRSWTTTLGADATGTYRWR